MSKQETSLDWLISQITTSKMSAKEVIAKAKAMHKEEIIEAYCTGCLHMAEDETIFPRETSERYYQATYCENPQPKPFIPFMYR